MRRPALTLPLHTSSHALFPHTPMPATSTSFSRASDALEDPASPMHGRLQALVGVEGAGSTFRTRLHFPLTW